MDVFLHIVTTLINHSTLNGADKAELLALLDELDKPAAGEAAPADSTSAGA